MTIAYTAVTGTTSPLLKTGIEYGIGILDGDMKQEYTTNSSSVSALCTCSFEDSDLFLAEMLGYSKRVGTELQRVLPERSGWDFGNTDVIHYAMDARLVKSLNWQENDVFFNWPVYAEMVYLVTFAAPLYEVKEDDEITYEHERFCVFSKKGNASNEMIPGGSMTFPSDGVKLNQVAVKTGRTTALTVKWCDVPYVNYAKLSTLANKVNASGFVLDGTTYTTETVLFENWSEDKRVNAFGKRVVDLTLNFTARVDGRSWNTVWRKAAGGGLTYEAPTYDGTIGGDKTFATADLNECFSFA